MRNGTHRNASDILISGGLGTLGFRPWNTSLDGFIDNRVCQIPDAFLVEMLRKRSLIRVRQDEKKNITE